MESRREKLLAAIIEAKFRWSHGQVLLTTTLAEEIEKLFEEKPMSTPFCRRHREYYEAITFSNGSVSHKCHSCKVERGDYATPKVEPSAAQPDLKREPGFYWVKSKGDLTVAELDVEWFVIGGDVPIHESDLSVIARIPMPDEPQISNNFISVACAKHQRFNCLDCFHAQSQQMTTSFYCTKCAALKQELAEATRQIEELKADLTLSTIHVDGLKAVNRTLDDWCKRHKERQDISLTALRILLDPNPTPSALNAVREDYPEFARLVEEWRDRKVEAGTERRKYKKGALMRLPPNSNFPHWPGLHLENDWCKSGGCIPACNRRALDSRAELAELRKRASNVLQLFDAWDADRQAIIGAAPGRWQAFEALREVLPKEGE